MGAARQITDMDLVIIVMVLLVLGSYAVGYQAGRNSRKAEVAHREQALFVCEARTREQQAQMKLVIEGAEESKWREQNAQRGLEIARAMCR